MVSNSRHVCRFVQRLVGIMKGNKEMRKYLLLFLLMVLFLSAAIRTAQAQHSVTLSCIPSTTTGVTSYNVYRAPCNGTITSGVCSLEGTFTKVGSSATCAYTDTAVTAAQLWSYYMTAVCPLTCSPTESGASNHVAATIPKDGAPNPPTGLGITTVALNTTGGQSTVAAAWQDDPGTLTTYKLTGIKNQGTASVVLKQGQMVSTGGIYNMTWSGQKMRSVTLQVCDSAGANCKSQTATVAQKGSIGISARIG